MIIIRSFIRTWTLTIKYGRFTDGVKWLKNNPLILYITELEPVDITSVINTKTNKKSDEVKNGVLYNYILPLNTLYLARAKLIFNKLLKTIYLK